MNMEIYNGVLKGVLVAAFVYFGQAYVELETAKLTMIKHTAISIDKAVNTANAVTLKQLEAMEKVNSYVERIEPMIEFGLDEAEREFRRQMRYRN